MPRLLRYRPNMLTFLPLPTPGPRWMCQPPSAWLSPQKTTGSVGPCRPAPSVMHATDSLPGMPSRPWPARCSRSSRGQLAAWVRGKRTSDPPWANESIDTIVEHIQGCFIDSMTAPASAVGHAPEADSEALVALPSYICWLATGATTGDTRMPGRGYATLDPTPQGFDRDRGARLYRTVCALCHGSDGQGTWARGGVALPAPLGCPVRQRGCRHVPHRYRRRLHQAQHASRACPTSERSGRLGPGRLHQCSGASPGPALKR